MPVAANKVKKSEKGQSFVELLLVAVFLIIFMLAIAEYGTLLNEYLNLVDGAREAARVASDLDPYDWYDEVPPDPIEVNPIFLQGTVERAVAIMAPLVLNQDNGDDIIVTFFSVEVVSGDFVIDRSDAHRYMSNQVSKFLDNDIKGRLTLSAPPRGILLVEIFYNYPQRLKVPIFTDLVPDPIPVYTYAIMPLPKIEP